LYKPDMDAKDFDRHLINCANVSFETGDFPIEVQWNDSKGFHLIAARDLKKDAVLLYEEPILAAVCEVSAGGWCRGCVAHTSTLYTNLKLCRDCADDERTVALMSALQITSPKGTLPNHVLADRLWFALSAEKPGALDKWPIDPAPATRQYPVREFPYGGPTRTLKSLAPLPRPDLTKVLLLCDDLQPGDLQNEAAKQVDERIPARLLRARNIVGNNVFKLMDWDKVSKEDVISDRRLPEVGRALYLLGSLINHSCDANSAAIAIDRRLAILARKPVKKGDEITIAYGNRAPTTTRQQYHLLRTYGFTCRCALCIACACCGATAPDGRLLQQCGSCGAIPYCSKDCQRKDWGMHKSFCKEIPVLRSLKGRSVSDLTDLNLKSPVGNLDPHFYF
jgi:hypothetical protein